MSGLSYSPSCRIKKIFIKKDKIYLPIEDFPKLIQLNYEDLSIDFVLQISKNSKTANFFSFF